MNRSMHPTGVGWGGGEGVREVRRGGEGGVLSFSLLHQLDDILVHQDVVLAHLLGVVLH